MHDYYINESNEIFYWRCMRSIKPVGHRFLFSVLVFWVTISDWPLLLGKIIFYGKFIFPKEVHSVPEYTGRISWNFPCHILVNLHQTSLVWGRDEHSQFISSHKLAPLTFGLSMSSTGKSPIFSYCWVIFPSLRGMVVCSRLFIINKKYPAIRATGRVTRSWKKIAQFLEM